MGHIINFIRDQANHEWGHLIGTCN